MLSNRWLMPLNLFMCRQGIDSLTSISQGDISPSAPSSVPQGNISGAAAAVAAAAAANASITTPLVGPLLTSVLDRMADPHTVKLSWGSAHVCPWETAPLCPCLTSSTAFPLFLTNTMQVQCGYVSFYNGTDAAVNRGPKDPLPLTFDIALRPFFPIFSSHGTGQGSIGQAFRDFTTYNTERCV